jgi:ABC-type antimicrobial peptide transport system permease subunit
MMEEKVGIMAHQGHEIGIRMALGARNRDVLKAILKQGLVLTLIGVAVGLAGTLVLTRVLSSLLYGVRATDPATFACVALLLITVALAASGIPAWRAARTNPMSALRYE